MNILLILPGFIIAFILIFCYEYRIKLIKTKPMNKVHFYVARDKNGSLWLYIGKPIRGYDEFHGSQENKVLEVAWHSFNSWGLNENDYDNLKWEDDPVEVFVNVDD